MKTMKLFLIVFFCAAAHCCLFSQLSDTLRLLKNAKTFTQHFQYTQAATTLDSCRRLMPYDADVLAQSGFCQYQLGKYSSARNFYAKIILQDSLNANAIYYVANTYEKENLIEQARTWFAKLPLADSTNSYYYRLNAFAALKAEQKTSAEQYFRLALRHNPNDVGCVNELCNILLDSNFVAAADSFAAASLAQDSLNTKLLYTKSRIQFRQEKYTESTESLEKILLQGDSAIHVRRLLGLCYLQTKRWSDAIRCFEPLLKIDPTRTENTHFYLAQSYEALKDTAASLQQYQAALNDGISDKVSVYLKKIAVFSALQNPELALKAHRICLDLTGDAESLFRLAQNADLIEKDRKKARQLYVKYLGTPDSAFRAFTENRLKEWSSDAKK